MSEKSRIVLSYHDSLLRATDVILLEENDWLNDNIIGFIFEYYEKEKFAKYSEDFLFVNPSIVQLMKFFGENEVKSLIECWDWKRKKLIFIPINDNCSDTNSGGSHWSLLVLHLNKNICYSYDSSKNFNAESAEQIFNIIDKAAISLKYQKLKFIEGSSPQQTNSSDCGVYVICVVEELCNWYIQQPDMEEDINLQSLIKPQCAKEKRICIKKLIENLRKQTET